MSNNNNNSTNPGALQFYNQLVANIQCAIALTGIGMNATLLWIHYRNKKLLRNSYGLMLTAMALFDACNEAGMLITMVMVSSGQTVGMRNCLFMQAIPIVGVHSSLLLILCISVDRLLCGLFPIQYMHFTSAGKNKHLFIGTILSLPPLYGTILLVAIHQSLINSGLAEKQVFCHSGEIVVGSALDLTHVLSLALNSITCLIYLLIWLNIKTHPNVMDRMKDRVGKSLSVIVCTTLLSWAFLTILVTWCIPYIQDQATQFLISRLAVQPMKMAQAINLLIVYVCSSEYRKLINKHFEWFARLFAAIFTAVCNNSGEDNNNNNNRRQMATIAIHPAGGFGNRVQLHRTAE